MQCFRRRQTLGRFASVPSSVFNPFNKDRHPNRRDVFKATAPLLSLSGVNSAPPDSDDPRLPETGSSSSDTTPMTAP